MEGAGAYAEEKGVRLLLEVHAPFHYEHPWIVAHLEVMHRTGSPALGLMPDMGTYVRRFPRVVSERALRDGAKPELVDLIVKTYDDGGDTHGLMDLVNYRNGGPADIGLARQATHYIWSEPKAMLEHMPLIGHIQAKFYEMTDEGSEYSIPYEEIVPLLVEGGFDGYLSSEYEGNRHIQDAFPVDSVEQVRRQHALFARLLGETHGERRPEMFDQYIVCEENFRTRDDGRPGGVVEVRMPYYRGLALSMVEAVDLTLDGTPVPASRTTFTVHGNTYTVRAAPADHRGPVGDGGAGRARLRDRRAAGPR